MVVILLIIHQDFWFWNDDRLVFGFMPIGLFYHACISISAAIVWFLATQFAWPAELEQDELKDADGGPRHESRSNQTFDHCDLSRVVADVGIFANRLFRGTKKDYLLASHSIGPFLLLMSLSERR